MKRILALAVMIGALQGCSILNTVANNEFSCPGMPNGVSCKTPREVYNMTNGDKAASSGTAAGDVPTYVFATKPGSGQLAPVPVLEQAKVMRVWIAPWVDSNKDLHWPGLMFTEIRPRKWHFGEEAFDGVEPPVPHRMYESASQTQEKADGSSNSLAEMPKNEAP